MDMLRLRKQLQEADEYLSLVTHKTGLTKPLEKAHELGAQREPKEVHVLVHPEFAWRSEPPPFMPVDTSRNDYRDRIQNVLELHPSSVVLTYPDARKHFSQFPYDDERAIATPDLTGRGTVQGMLHPEGIRMFLDQVGSLRPDDRYIIHGAAFDRCPSHFARQLLGMVLFGRYFPPICKQTPDDAPEVIHQLTVLEALYHSHFIVKQTRIRLGIQHNTWHIKEADSLTKDLIEDGVTEIFTPFQGAYAAM